jgi:hypothetical protein
MAKHPTKRVAEPPTVAYSDEDSNAEMGDFEDLEATNEDVVNGAMDSDAGSDDEWAGMNDDEENPQATPVAAAHASGQKTHVLPSGEELRRIKEASELFQSSSFKLQVRRLCYLIPALPYGFVESRLTHCYRMFDLKQVAYHHLNVS